jgi:hypothetical protein
VTVGSAPLTVTFSGAGSSSPDGSIASYSWNFGDGTTGSGEIVTHTYTVEGDYQPILTIADSVGNNAQAPAEAIVVGGLGSISGTSGFGSVQVGEATAPQTFTLTNVGAAPLTVSGFNISGDGLGDAGGAADVVLSSDTCTGATLAADASCTFAVSMVPQAEGLRVVMITANDGGVGPDMIVVTATGVAPPPGWTTATVVNSNGQPLVAVPISFRNATGGVTTLMTGSDGVASTAHMPGQYTVTATYANGTQSQSLTVTASGPNTVTFSTVAVTVQVNDPSSADIAAASVAHAGNTGSFGPKTPVNSSGQVTFQALPGTSSFTAYVAGGYQTQSLSVTASGPNTVTFSTFAMTVTVLKDGSPLATATVAHAGNTGTYGSKVPVNASGQVIFQALAGTSYFTAWDGSSYSTTQLTVSGPASTTMSVS